MSENDNSKTLSDVDGVAQTGELLIHWFSTSIKRLYKELSQI